MTKLSDYMAKRDLRDWEVAVDIGRDRSTVSRIRAGTQKPDWPTMLALYHVTRGEVAPNDFLPRDYKLSRR